ncbi:MAG: hypothetical protein ACE5FQ_14755 [Thiogranum sp.]
MLVVLIPGFFLAACSKQPQDAVTGVPGSSLAPVSQDTVVVEKGMYFKPGLGNFRLHNEYDDDGDGDGVNETHVRRYISDKGDSAFSMTTGDRLWAWSLDTRGGNDNDIRGNYVIRDSNCDGVFDERYSLNAEFHVPDCLVQQGAGEAGKGV